MVSTDAEIKARFEAIIAEALQPASDRISQLTTELAERKAFIAQLMGDLSAERTAHQHTNIDLKSTEEDRFSVIAERDDAIVKLKKLEQELAESHTACSLHDRYRSEAVAASDAATAKLGQAIDMLQRLLAESVRLTNNNRLDNSEEIVILCHEARKVAYADSENKAAAEAHAEMEALYEAAKRTADASGYRGRLYAAVAKVHARRGDR